MLILLLACAPAPITLNSSPPEATRQVTVTGTARLEVPPDEAVISLEFSSTAPTMKTAHKNVNDHTADFQTAIKALGLPDNHLSLGSTRDNPNYRYDGSQRIYSYTSTIHMTVKTSDFEQVADIVDTAVNANVTSTSVYYQVADMPTHKKKARDMAITAAREKADQLAKGMGANLGEVLTISEGMSSSWGYGNTLGNAQAIATETSDNATSGYAPDTEPLTITLNVSFALK